MKAQDYDYFVGWFDLLAVTHRLLAAEDLRAKMRAEYFDILRPYPVEAVQSAYETLRRRAKKWPVPADWCEALPPCGAAARLPLMTVDEMRDTTHAEALGYEASALCACAECMAADATHLYPRFVPRLDSDGQVFERRHPDRQGKPVVIGRWVHGAELKRWYRTRGDFYEKFKQLRAQELAAQVARRHPEARMQRLVTEARAVTAEVT